MLPKYKEITGAFKLFDFIVENARKSNDIFLGDESGLYFDFVMWVSEHEIDQSEFYLNLNDASLAIKKDNINYFHEKVGFFNVDFLMLQNGKIFVNDNNGFYWLFDGSEQVPFEKEVKFD